MGFEFLFNFLYIYFAGIFFWRVTELGFLSDRFLGGNELGGSFGGLLLLRLFLLLFFIKCSFFEDILHEILALFDLLIHFTFGGRRREGIVFLLDFLLFLLFVRLLIFDNIFGEIFRPVLVLKIKNYVCQSKLELLNIFVKFDLKYRHWNMKDKTSKIEERQKIEK